MTDPTIEEKNETDDSGSSDQPSQDDAKPKKRRRRGRRRGKGGADKATDQDKAPEPRDDDREFDEDFDDDTDDETPRSKGPRPDAESLDNWEEIFETFTFADLGLRNSVIRGTDAAGFKHPTKIQAEMIPHILAGKDVLGQSRTGTGKTAAFGLPLFNLLERDVPFQVVILGPTRELAVQIADEIRELGRFTPIRVTTVYGGQPIRKQAARLDQGPEIIVATPGRLLDMLERRHLNFNNVRIAVLDEVDRMLDIGFRDDIRRILGLIKREHQTVFVSATISEEIEKLARKFMRDPVRLETTGGSLTVTLVDQHYISVAPWDKRRFLHHILTHEDPDVTLVFCRTKRTVDDVARYLSNKGVDAHAIHGDMYQGRRNSVIRRLREGQLSVLVASDVAARGLDVEGITHVINYDLPDDPEVYIHRIGRTARAGRRGIAWSFVSTDEGPLLTAIEKLANVHIDERPYPDFKPGPIPERLRAEKEANEARIAKLQSRSRFSGPNIPTKKKVDEHRFPGGVVPTRLPDKRLGGRAKTARSMKKVDPNESD